MKVITIVGTRPEIIRLSRVIDKLDIHFEHILVHTGQNWDPNLNDIFFEEMKIRKPDYFLDIVGKNLGESMANIISKSYNLFLEHKPDALLILGDTNSALSVISAKRLKIPIFHMEAGNRCYDQTVPEEINRKIVDHTSDINLPYTEHSRHNLIAEGFRSDSIIVTGSPLTEVYDYYKNDIEKSTILKDLQIQSKKYILWSTHREENVDIPENWANIILAINTVAEKYPDFKIIMSTHPRTRKNIENQSIIFRENVVVHNPFGLFDYIHLQMESYCTISDSGTISEEAGILGIPAINFRLCTERPEAMDEGLIVLSGLSVDNLMTAINITVSKDYSTRTIPTNYKNINVSDKIVNIIASYTHVINRTVWRK